MVVGGGGREHAIAWKLAKSSRVATVYVAPGNGGTAREAKVVNVPLGVGQHEALIEFAQSHKIKLCVVGPEAPLIERIFESTFARRTTQTKDSTTNSTLSRFRMKYRGFRWIIKDQHNVLS